MHVLMLCTCLSMIVHSSTVWIKFLIWWPCTMHVYMLQMHAFAWLAFQHAKFVPIYPEALPGPTALTWWMLNWWIGLDARGLLGRPSRLSGNDVIQEAHYIRPFYCIVLYALLSIVVVSCLLVVCSYATSQLACLCRSGSSLLLLVEKNRDVNRSRFHLC